MLTVSGDMVAIISVNLFFYLICWILNSIFFLSYSEGYQPLRSFTIWINFARCLNWLHFQVCSCSNCNLDSFYLITIFLLKSNIIIYWWRFNRHLFFKLNWFQFFILFSGQISLPYHSSFDLSTDHWSFRIMAAQAFPAVYQESWPRN